MQISSEGILEQKTRTFLSLGLLFWYLATSGARGSGALQAKFVLLTSLPIPTLNDKKICNTHTLLAPLSAHVSF